MSVAALMIRSRKLHAGQQRKELQKKGGERERRLDNVLSVARVVRGVDIYVDHLG